ncbi:MAG: polyamine aminopropyltransferase, partial [Gammaproteobacteria bacterium]
AGKGLELSRFRKRPLPTRYYSPSIHEAALALPPFLREAL